GDAPGSHPGRGPSPRLSRDHPEDGGGPQLGAPGAMSPPRPATRMAKIIATVGPASESGEVLSRLILAGVDVFRLNLSHGTHDEHRRRMRRVRRLSRDLGKTVAVLFDLPGPKIRTGTLTDGVPIPLAAGARVAITTRNVAGRPGLISTAYKNLPRDVHKGSRILLDD